MVIFKTISYFRKQLDLLRRVRRKVYKGVEEEIAKEFSNAEISIIRSNRDMILIEEDLIVVKFRMADKRQHLSKRDGYRLIYLVSKVDELVVFLDLYPKNGPLQRLDIDNNELKRLLRDFIEEGGKGLLEDYCF